MSQDSYVYISGDIFPKGLWNEIVLLFSAVGGENKWVIDTDDRTIWLDVMKLPESHIHSDIYNWQIGIHYQAPYGPRKLWATLNLPYHCIALMENVVYHDPLDEVRIKELEAFDKFANEFITKYTSLQKLAKFGLLDSNEQIKLGT